MYASNLNALVQKMLDLGLIEKIGTSVGKITLKDPIAMGTIAHLLLLLNRLLVHSTENYAKLRLHLSKGSPTFLPSTIKPFFNVLMSTPPKHRKQAWFERTLVTVRCLAVLTFKVKTVRECVAENHKKDVADILKAIGGWNHPQVGLGVVELGGLRGRGRCLELFRRPSTTATDGSAYVVTVSASSRASCNSNLLIPPPLSLATLPTRRCSPP